MADLFLSYAPADCDRAAALGAALATEGLSVQWERQAGGSVVEAIDEAGVVLVLWSAAARNALSVRAEATEALDQGKIVQATFGGVRPLLPFGASGWVELGDRDKPDPRAWEDLRGQIDARLSARSGSGAMDFMMRPEPDLQELGRITLLGWAALVTAILVALAVLAAARRLVSPGAFGIFSIAAALVAVALLAATVLSAVRPSPRGRA